MSSASMASINQLVQSNQSNQSINRWPVFNHWLKQSVNQLGSNGFAISSSPHLGAILQIRAPCILNSVASNYSFHFHSSLLCFIHLSFLCSIDPHSFIHSSVLHSFVHPLLIPLFHPSIDQPHRHHRQQNAKEMSEGISTHFHFISALKQRTSCFSETTMLITATATIVETQQHHHHHHQQHHHRRRRRHHQLRRTN